MAQPHHRSNADDMSIASLLREHPHEHHLVRTLGLADGVNMRVRTRVLSTKYSSLKGNFSKKNSNSFCILLSKIAWAIRYRSVFVTIHPVILPNRRIVSNRYGRTLKSEIAKSILRTEKGIITIE